MSSRLHEVIALTNGKKTEVQTKFNEIQARTKKPALFQGITRSYEPLRQDDPERLPSETQTLQLRVADVLDDLDDTFSDFYNLVLTQDTGNQEARADIIINGRTILKEVPITSMLYLEKQLDQLKTFYESLPTLDPARSWNFDAANDAYRVESSKLREIRDKEPLVLYEATKEHPAQVTLIEKGRTTGTWTTVETSGAITYKAKQELLSRLRLLKEATLSAREKANQTVVDRRQDGNNIFAFLHGA